MAAVILRCSCGCLICSALMIILLAVFVYFRVCFQQYNHAQARYLACKYPDNSTTIGGFDLYTNLLGYNTSMTPIIVIHGGPGHSSFSFKGSLNRLADTGRRVLFYDQRGSGVSQMWANGSYTVDDLTAEIDELRTTVLQSDQVIILAHSSGGAIGQKYVATYSSHVKAAIFVGSTSPDNDMTRKWVWKWLGPGLLATALGLPPSDPPAADEWLDNETNADDISRLYDANINSSVLENTGPIRYSTWFSVSQSLAGTDIVAQISAVMAPVLVVWGVADNQYTGETKGFKIAASFPNSKTAAIPKASHWPFLENPGDFFAAVCPFLEEVE